MNTWRDYTRFGKALLVAAMLSVLLLFAAVPRSLAHDSYGKAREAAERALVLDPNLGEAHAAMGWVKMVHDWDWLGGGCLLPAGTGPGAGKR